MMGFHFTMAMMMGFKWVGPSNPSEEHCPLLVQVSIRATGQGFHEVMSWDPLDGQKCCLLTGMEEDF